MSIWQKLSRGETTFDFVGLRKRWFMISGILLLVSVAALGIRQLNLGLEFEGGVVVQADNPSGITVDEMRDALAALELRDARIQLVDEGTAVRVQTAPLDPTTEERLVETVVAATGTDRADVSLESVGPTFGELVARQMLIALAAFLAMAALFISWRLQLKMALTGLAALVHDLILTVGIYAVTGFRVTPATVIALLTILGYSLYDTVVVFDKVREFEEQLGERNTYSQIVNRAMNQVLVRSLGTSLTSLFPVGSLLFIGAILLGATSLQDFALALFVGIATGTYSSIFLAGPMLAAWKEREPGWIEHRERLEERARARGEAVPDTAPPPPASVETERPPSKPPQPGAGAPPRPPKGRKR